MRARNVWIIVIILVIALGFGGYKVFHKTPKPKTTSSASTVTTKSSTSSKNSANPTQATTVNNSILITKNNSTNGNYLTNPLDDTLYTDGSSTDNCTEGCLSAWPPYLDKGPTTGLPSNISTVKRLDNGEIQFTYKGLPLYFFSSDSPGHVTGDGISGFSVARP